jgi:vacuolar-type H+-ATPase subunit F/Vma7
MKHFKHALMVSALVTALGCHHEIPIHQLAGTPNWQPDASHAAELSNEEHNGNGIEVSAPKIYDDASLRMMLDATRAKLATMSGLDQGSLISSLGNVTGATINQTQLGFQVLGPTPPATSTTNTGATNSVTTNGSLPAGNTSVPGTVTVTTSPTESTVTTSPSAPTVPAVSPGIAFTPPSSVAPSSLDILNEQMQLSYEMTNLQLLLEGALSDRFVTNQRLIKPRVTLGFPISLRAPAEFKDAVAVVEVEVTTAHHNYGNVAVPEPPSITALLPQEKTYNVAAMTDHMTSVGAGALIGTVGVTGSFLAGHKTFYLVQDQDTVAMQRPASRDPNAASFTWEFRPVLGQHYVRGGMKQTFVQLAFPVDENFDCYGTVRLRTYWRRFDQKNGIDKEVIPESVLVSARTFSLPRFDLAPEVSGVDFTDLGDGTLMVHVKGRYLAGTYVQVGPVRYDSGKTLVVEDTGLKFTVPVAALAIWKGHIVARSGESTEILQPSVQTPLRALNQDACVGVPAPILPADGAVPMPLTSIEHEVTIQPLSESDSVVHVEVVTSMSSAARSKLLLLIGNKVFGLRDAPIQRELTPTGVVISATVPTSLLIASPSLRVFIPFWSDVEKPDDQSFQASYPLTGRFGPDSAVEHLVLVSIDSTGNGAYLLYGNDLAGARILVPDSGATLDAVDSIAQDRIRLVKITKAALQTTKKLILQKASEQRPLLLDIPDAKAVAPKVTVDSPVIVNTNELTVSAEQAADITAVMLGDKKLQWKFVDKGTIRLLNLKADGVTNEQKTRELAVQYKNGVKATVTFEVVAARIGVK